MYLIKLKHTSDVEDVYTEETQTATCEEFAKVKYRRMINRWFDILCPHISWHLFKNQYMLANKQVLTEEEDYKLCLEVIDAHLNYLNLIDGKQRKFTIEIVNCSE